MGDVLDLLDAACLYRGLGKEKVMKKYRSYWTYSIGCFVAWGVILAVRAAAFGGTSTTHDVLFVFAGWCIAWVSSTIVRSVYPPPKHWLELSTPDP
jgi:hypothetical protein